MIWCLLAAWFGQGYAVTRVAQEHPEHPSKDWRTLGDIVLALLAAVLVFNGILFWATR